jgi:hypothetical protein
LHDGLVSTLATSAGDLALTHVLACSCESTNEGVINFGDPVHLLECSGSHRVADAVEHEPRRLLGHCKGTPEFVRRDAVLAVGDEPDSGKPLVEAERGILEDRPDLEGEQLFAPLALRNLAELLLPVEALNQRHSPPRQPYPSSPLLAEFDFRYSTRMMTDQERFAMLMGQTAKRLTYKTTKAS